MEFLPAESLAEAVQQKVHSLTRLLDEYESFLSPDTCRHFIDGIRILVDSVQQYHSEWLAFVSKAYADKREVGSDLVRSTSRNCLSILANIQSELLSLLDASVRQPVFMIKDTLERALSLLGMPNGLELTLYASPSYLYGFVGKLDFVATELEKLKGFSGKAKKLEEAERLPEWHFFLSYPIAERDSALNQTVIAHELAHVVDYVHDIQPSVIPATLDEGSFQKMVERSKESIRSEDLAEAQCLERCVPTLESWVREVVADVLAVHALGPAYFFSFLEFFANAGTTDEADDLHPAPSYRGVLLREELQYLGYTDEFGLIGKQIGAAYEVLRSASDRAVKRYRDERLVAHRTIEAHRTAILQKLRERAASFAFNAKRYEYTVPPIMEQLKRGCVPMDGYRPNEQPRSLSAVAILNAGWELYRTDRKPFLDLFLESVSIPERLINLNQLLFKALEANEVVRTYFS